MSNTNTRFTSSLLALIVAVALLAGGCDEQGAGVEISGGEPPTHTATPTPAPTTDASPPANPNVLRVWRDVGGSENNEALEAIVVDDLIATLAKFSDRITGVEVVRFAYSDHPISDEPTEKFMWGTPPAIEAFKPNLDNAPTEVNFFQEAHDSYINEQQRKYDEQNARLRGEYQARVAEQLKKLKVALVRHPDVHAPCTPFTSLAARMKEEDIPLNLTLTDGYADCPSEQEGIVAGVPVKGKHVIIQLTRRADSQGDDGEMQHRAAFLQTLFPAAKVVRAYMPGKAVEMLFR
jgi:hypothetical protein